PSGVYDIFKILKGESIFNNMIDVFSPYFSVEDHYVSALAAPETDILSQSEIECLDASIVEIKNLKFGVVSAKAHDMAWPSAAMSDHMETTAVICINSEINFNVIGSQMLLDLQYHLTAEGNAYIDHDSFADCSELHIMKIRSLTGAVVNDTTSVLGEVSASDL